MTIWGRAAQERFWARGRRKAKRNRLVSAAEQGDWAPVRTEAEDWLNRCVWECGADHPETARALAGLGSVYLSEGQTAEAEPLLRRAVALTEIAHGPWHAEVADLLGALADAYLSVGLFSEAEAARARALQIHESAGADSREKTAQALDDLALVHKAKGDKSEAARFHRRALAVWEETSGSRTPGVARCLTHLAALCIEDARYAEAEPLLARAVEAWGGSPNPNDLYAIITLACYGDLFRKTGRADEAQTMERRAKAVMARYV